ncbi:hypothetical protein [Rathayibacter sp. VKM Ac-2760]|uniref:hypothetical protein n=1 Tax=Rathayibacter sp. VKM Ac-2760 TaxID=2609253 RepID=UPI001317967E|nr:hypothetical protein [Rathayibacter sp. VKM Ac-2760]QHC57209.1 hypothetical protein GSU72_00405 [Rathayibacter sp. VKM Ac-2760]
MDIGGWLNFLAQSTVLLVGCHLIVALVTGLALAPPAGVPKWAALVICALVPVLGPLVLAVVVLVRTLRRPDRASARPAVADAAAIPTGAAGAGTPPAEPTAFPGFGTPPPPSFGAGSFGASSFGTGSFGTASPPASSFGASSFEPAFGAPSSASTAWTAGSEAVAAAVVPPARGLRARAVAVRATHQPLSTVRLALLAVLVVAVAATASMLLVGWFTFDSRIVPPLSVVAWGTGIDVAVLTSAGLLAVVLVLAWWRPSRTAAVAAVTLGGVWTFVAGSVLALAAPVTELLSDIGALSYDVGDVLGSFGLRGEVGVVTLPEGVDLSAVGLPGRTVDLSAVDLAAPIPAATLELGPGWFIALAVGIVVMLWALVEVAAVNRVSARR